MKAAKVLAIIVGFALLVAGSHNALAQSPISLSQSNAFGKISITATLYTPTVINGKSQVSAFKVATKDIITLVVGTAASIGLVPNTNVPKGAQLVLTNGTDIVILQPNGTPWPGPATNFDEIVNLVTEQGISVSTDTTKGAVDSDSTITDEPVTLTVGDPSVVGLSISGVALEKSSDVANHAQNGVETMTYSASLVNGSGTGRLIFPQLGTTNPVVIVGSGTIKGKSTAPAGP